MARDRNQEHLDVMRAQARSLEGARLEAEALGRGAESAIAESVAFLTELGLSPVLRSPTVNVPLVLGPPRPWDEVLAEARAQTDEAATLEHLLSPAEIAAVASRLKRRSEAALAPTRLDAFHVVVAGLAGLAGAAVHTLGVGVPGRGAWFGLPPQESGPIAAWVRERLDTLLSPEQVRALELRFQVPFDASVNKGLFVPVEGLNPSSHRLISLGHDPLLGFLFGVRDVLRGTMTTIDGAGRLVVQARGAPSGEGLFAAILQVAGHLLSDMGTARGLPAPLMGLALGVNAGRFGPHGHSVSEIVQIMYRRGYDFRHFLAMSVAPMVVEVLVRAAMLVRGLMDGLSLEKALPMGSREAQPQLHTTLFLAHTVATSCNAGLVAISGNPLHINLPQWMAFAGHTVSQLRWTLHGREGMRHGHVLAELDRELDVLMAARREAVGGRPVVRLVGEEQE